MHNSFSEIWKLFNFPLFKLGSNIITAFSIIVFIIVLIAGWFAGKYYKKVLFNLKKKSSISQATLTLLGNIGYYIIFIIAFLIALKTIGLDISSFALIAGALSVGIGFGLQNVISNLVSGLILMIERTIKVGDYIQIDDETRGEVIDISMRSTIIKTNDNINLIIPNQTFIQNNIINWTLGDDIVRLKVPFGVAYGCDIDKMEKVVLTAIKNTNLPYINDGIHKTEVIFKEMSESSLNFELFVWVKGEHARKPERTNAMFLKIIYRALNEANITIPFPQHDLHIKDSIPLEIKIKK